MYTVKWCGYEFTVYDPRTVTWYDVGGVYIFSGANANSTHWLAHYVGETVSFKNRLPCHERWDEAWANGATHVHALAASPEATRLRIQDELIRSLQPPLNTHGR
jgi:hypothetical protein